MIDNMMKNTQKTQYEIAKKLKISAGYLSQLETGKHRVSYHLAYKWSKALGKSMDWWLTASPGDIKQFLRE